MLIHLYTPNCMFWTRSYISPAVAVGEATKAVVAMGYLAKTNFERGCAQLFSYDKKVVAVIDQDENALDQFTDTADRFLIGLSKVVESETDDRQVDMLIQSVPNFERIGDYATNMAELAEQLKSEGAEFSDSAKKELELLFAAVNEILTITIHAYEQDDLEAARSIEPLEEVIDDMVLILRDRHTKRLKSGVCTVSSGLVFMEALTYLECASDQCSSIAVMMLARHNEEILQNHYAYLQELHKGDDETYKAELESRRIQYINALKQIH